MIPWCCQELIKVTHVNLFSLLFFLTVQICVIHLLTQNKIIHLNLMPKARTFYYLDGYYVA